MIKGRTLNKKIIYTDIGLLRSVSIVMMVLLLLFREIIQPLQSSTIQAVLLLLLLVSNLHQINKTAIVWYGIFALISCISYVTYNYMNPVSTIINTLLYVILVSLMCNSDKEIRLFFYTMSLGGSILLSFLLVRYKDILGAGRLGNYMSGTSYGSSIYFSYYIISVLCSSCVVLILYAKSNVMKVLLITCIVIGFTIAIFNGAKKGYMMPIVFMLFYFLIGAKQNRMKFLLQLTVFIILLVFIWNQLKGIELLQRYFINRVETMFSVLSEGGRADDEGSTSDRLIYISVAFDKFLDHPIFGIGGLGYSPTFFRNIIHVSHPHNDFLNLLVAGGITLFIVFYWFPLFLVYKLGRIFFNKNYTKEHILMTALIGTLLFNNFNSTTFNIPVINIFYVIIFNVLNKKKVYS